MIKIFLAGPIKIRTLDEQIRQRIDKIIEQNFEILVGDANGVDKSIQEYLYSKRYQKVRVYCVNEPRNNVGHWEIKQILNNEKRGFKVYTLKDKEMAKDADYGFMIWNCKSKGTLNNIINLIEQNKKTRVYIKNKKKIMNITSLDGLYSLIKECDPIEIDKTLNELDFHKRIENIEQNSLVF